MALVPVIGEFRHARTQATEGRLRQTRLARAAVAAHAQISEEITAVEIVMGKMG